MRTRTGRLLERWGRAYDGLDRRYHHVLGWALDRPWTIARRWPTVVFVASLSTLVDDRHRVRADGGSRRVPGLRRPAARHLVRRERGGASPGSRRRSSAMPEVTQVFSTVGVDGEVRSSELRVKTTPRRTSARAASGDQVGGARACWRRCRFVEARSPTREFMQGAPYQPPINVYVRGDDMVALQRVSSELAARRSGQIPGAVDIDSSLVSRQARDGGARQSRPGRRPGLQTWAACRAAARHGRGHRADASCATATGSTTSACGSRPSSGTTSRRSHARRSTRRPVRSVRTGDIVRMEPALARAASSASSGAARRRSASTSRATARRRDRRRRRR